MQQRRNFYRVHYPRGQEPVLVVSGRRYAIMDLSEEGLRIRLPPTTNLAKGTRVGGDVVFPDGDLCAVRGSVLRSDNSECVIRLSEGIPLAKIMDEQRRMIKAMKGD